MDSQEKDYLAEYDSAVEAEKYPLVQKWMKTEPLPFFAQLRRERPILVTPECTLVSLYTDVTDILKMPKIFNVDLYKPKMGVTDTDEGYLMAHDDDALHYREKSIMQGMLNRNDLPEIRRLVSDACQQELAKAKRGRGQIDLIDDYCRYIPTVLVRDYFGLDGVEPSDLMRWSYWNQYDAFHNQPFDLNPPELNDHILSEHAKATKELVTYIAELLGKKLLMLKLESVRKQFFGVFYYLWKAFDFIRGEDTGTPGDDVVMRILRSHFDDDIEFDIARQGVNIGGLLIGSVETTAQAVSQAIEFLQNDPNLLARARAAANEADTAPFDAVVWEALRFVPISPYMFRTASIDCAVALGTSHETEIAAGTNVLLLTQSAMFDTYAHKKPDRFDANRNWYHNFNFGYASHECLGKYVGMVLIPEMVKHVLLDEALKPDQPIDYKDTPFPAEYQFSWS